MHHPTTPDGRYFVPKGRLWRCSDPSLPESTRLALVQELMTARRGVKSALASRSEQELARARRAVHAAKVALGERGAPWWGADEPDLNRRRIGDTPYADWWRDRAPVDNTRP